MRNTIYYIEKLPPPETLQPYQLIDIGKIISGAYFSDKESFTKQIDFDSAEYLKSIIDSCLDNSIPRIVFQNFGILQEKGLGLNIQKFFLDYAKYNNVFLYWPYEIKEMEYLKWPKNTPDNKCIHFDKNILQRAII